MTGMLIGKMNFRKMFTYKRVLLVSALRLVIVPVILILLLKYSGAGYTVPEGSQILFVALLAVITPTASTITQMAQVYRGMRNNKKPNNRK